MASESRIITALDVPNIGMAVALKDLLGDRTRYKAGLELCTGAGVPAVMAMVGGGVFLDLKFHDIPNTVAGAVKAAATHRPWMLNVHCLGGKAMMEAASKAAREAAEHPGGYRPLVVGVTILTNHDKPSLKAIGIDPFLEMKEVVRLLAILAYQAGLDGVVCSPQEIMGVKKAVGRSFLTVTPGIRSKNDPPDDQKRTMTAGQAAGLGTDFFVIGRPITRKPDPIAAVEEFEAEIAAG